jgi:L-alanine-DL-glutamate epimerase-like enolase superfamily enzyme
MIKTLDDIVALGKEVRDAGFKALKTNMIVFENATARMHGPGTGRGIGHPELNLSSAMQTGFVDLLAAFEEGAGPGIQLMLDLNLHFKPEGYKRLAHLSEQFDMLWLEMDTFEPGQLAHIRSSTTTPIASLEAIHGRRNLRAYLEAHAVDAAIIDVEWNGMPEAIRMAAMCDAYEINCAAHNASGPLATLASAHFCAVIPNFRIMEFDGDEVPWRRSFLTNPYKVENGEFFIPSGPGWGAEIDEEAVKARPGKHSPFRSPRLCYAA